MLMNFVYTSSLLCFTLLSVLTIPTHQSGTGYIKFVEYHDTSICYNGGECDFYFKKFEVYDSTRSRLVYVEKTDYKRNRQPVNFETDIPQIKPEYNFTMKTNDTVKLRIEVWDADSFGKDDKIRDIDDLVIPFHVITATSTWTSKQLSLSNPYGYFMIKIKISCSEHFEGPGCNYCSVNYYTSTCDKYCAPIEGNYSCSPEGDMICAEHKTEKNCDVCEEGWAGLDCKECAENYYPAGVCNKKCIPSVDRYTCNDDGSKACYYNWVGDDCYTCAAGYYGADCGTPCFPTEEYYCSVTGKKVCMDIIRSSENNCAKDSPIDVAALVIGSIALLLAVVAVALSLFVMKLFQMKAKQQPREAQEIDEEMHEEEEKENVEKENVDEDSKQYENAVLVVEADETDQEHLYADAYAL